MKKTSRFVLLAKYISVTQIKANQQSGPCDMHEREMHTGFGWKNLKVTDHGQNLGI